MLKKVASLILTLTIVLLIFGCSTPKESQKENDEAVQKDESVKPKQDNSIENKIVKDNVTDDNIKETYNVIAEFEDSFTVKGAGVFEYAKDLNDKQNASWQEQLKNFLAMNYPSLFNEAAIKKRAEIEELWSGQGNFSNSYINEAPHDILFKILKETLEISEIYLPGYYKFHDLDNDGIPEAFMAYYLPYSGFAWYEIFQYSDDSFKRIGLLWSGENAENLFIDRDNKIVCISSESTRLFELSNGKFVYSDYTDTNGSKSYGGIPYSEIGYYSAEDMLMGEAVYNNDGVYIGQSETMVEYIGLENLPEYDCSGIIESIGRVNP